MFLFVTGLLDLLRAPFTTDCLLSVPPESVSLHLTRGDDAMSINVTCAARNSRPPANLTWYLNKALIGGDSERTHVTQLSDGAHAYTRMPYACTQEHTHSLTYLLIHSLT